MARTLQESRRFILSSLRGVTHFVFSTVRKMLPFSLITLTHNRDPNVHFTIEREKEHVLLFLDVLINNTDPNFILTYIYRKRTNTGLLCHHVGFFSFTNKFVLIKPLIDRLFKTSKIQMEFHKDPQNLCHFIIESFPLGPYKQVFFQIYPYSS